MSNRNTLNRMKPPKLANGLNKVFCRFRSKESYDKFQRERTRPKKAQCLRKTSGSQMNNSKEEPLSPIRPPAIMRNNKEPQLHIEDQENYQCIKCSKNLIEKQLAIGLCNQCQKMEKYLACGNFEKFVRFVYEFKTNKVPSYSSAIKLKRAESVESVLSFTLDKPGDSTLKKQFKPINPFQQSNNLQFSSRRLASVRSVKFDNFSKKFNESPASREILVGGYFCNECKVEPIEGRRFHCLTCSDFDLCERCYFMIGHKHEVKIFKDTKQQLIRKVKENVLRQSQSWKKALPKLTISMQSLEKVPKLFGTSQLNPKSLQKAK